MAAKKDTAPKTAAPAADKKAALETALAQIEKQFGKGAVMKLGANVTMQVDAIPHRQPGPGSGARHRRCAPRAYRRGLRPRILR